MNEIIQDFDINRGDEFDSKSTTTISTTTTTLTTTTTGTTAAPTTSVLAVEWETTAEVEEEIPTGPPALAVPPMCSFRHTQRIENETCKDAAGWRTDAQRFWSPSYYISENILFENWYF